MSYRTLCLKFQFQLEAQSFNHWKVKVKVAQLCQTLCDPMDYTSHGIF